MLLSGTSVTAGHWTGSLKKLDMNKKTLLKDSSLIQVARGVYCPSWLLTGLDDKTRWSNLSGEGNDNGNMHCHKFDIILCQTLPWCVMHYHCISHSLWFQCSSLSRWHSFLSPSILCVGIGIRVLVARQVAGIHNQSWYKTKEENPARDPKGSKPNLLQDM